MLRKKQFPYQRIYSWNTGGGGKRVWRGWSWHLAAGSCFSLIFSVWLAFEGIKISSHAWLLTIYPSPVSHAALSIARFDLGLLALLPLHSHTVAWLQGAGKWETCSANWRAYVSWHWTKSQCTLPSPYECEESDPMDICYCLVRSGPRGIKWEGKCRSVDKQTPMRENTLPSPPFYPAFGRTCFHLHPYM